MADKPIEVHITFLFPSEEDLPRLRGDVTVLTPPVIPPPPLVTQTRLPAQPADVPVGHVWTGIRFGFVPYSGTRPLPGDLIAIVGGTARRYATSPLAREALRWPTFGQACQCQCPGNEGVVVYATTCRSVVNLIALDAVTGAALQFFGTNELGGIGGTFNNAFMAIPVALDQAAPYDLWVMDDRRFWSTRILDSAPTATRGYFTLVRYALTGGQYAPVAYVDLPDPGQTGFIVENDPPALGTNFLSVVDAVPHVTLRDSPARYLTVAGATVTTHTLLRNGAPYARGLRGNIVTVPTRPAPSGRRYVLAAGGTTAELLEFTATDVITRVIPLADLTSPFHLAAFCNRLLVLNGSIDEPA